MVSYRLSYIALPLGLAVLVAGCGGAQNPLRLDTPPTHSFFDGMWDGFTLPVVLLMRLARSRDYGWISNSPADAYYIGYLFGVILVIAAVLWIIDAIRG